MERSYRVMKFGGSSTGAPERVIRATELIAREAEEHAIAVVFSAMGDSTDWLIEAADEAAAGHLEAAEALVDRVEELATGNAVAALAHFGHGAQSEAVERVQAIITETLSPLRQLLYGVSLVRECTLQTVDLVMSFGERISAQVMREMLAARGLAACYVDARTWTVTDAHFGRAHVDWTATAARIQALRPAWAGRISVHTGFLGQTEDGRTTTLGRNGSDYTTTLLARGLGAAEVNIWTDVSGVMTADPALVGDAYPIAQLTYWEALELANFGARMFHPRTMIPLIESGIRLRIRNTMHPDQPGTVVSEEGAHDPDRPTSVTSLENLALLDITYRRLSRQPQIGERVLRALQQAGITVWMATQSAHGQAIAVTIPMAEVERAEAAVREELALEMARGEVEAPRCQQPITLLSLVAETMGQTVNVAGRFFDALGAVGVNVRGIAQGASSRSISCAIDAADTPVAVRTVHAAFNFAHQEINVLLLGHGTVGAQLVEQVRTQTEVLRDVHGVRVRVVGIADSRRLLFDEAGIDLEGWRDAIAKVEPGPRGEAVGRDVLERLRRLSVPILVDCTAATGMERLYAQAFAQGVHVVSANKMPLTLPMATHRALRQEARANFRAWHYETTVGASLPVIETLKNLVRTGDRVERIEGSFSGTLGYLTNELMAGASLSEAVRRAMELGYTEPHPREDLSGNDVARKALILARELGLAVDLQSIEVEPLVAPERMAIDDVDAFLEALAEEDVAFEARIARLRDEGKTLRYLAQIAPGEAGQPPTIQVGPVEIPGDHPAVRLRGSEAFVAFRTRRYSDYPLIVQGSGAGGAVTAAGVLADVLRISQNLRGG